MQPTISNLIPSQFPLTYQENGPQFVAFIQAYYEWLEQSYQGLNLTVYNASTNFANGEVVYQSNGTTNVATGTVISIQPTAITINNFSGAFTSNLAIVGATSNAVANIASVSNTVTFGNPIYQARNLLNYLDIDTTLDQFVQYFQDTYLSGIQFNTLSDKRLTVKKILDLYRAKGNIRALKLLFQLVYDEDIDVYLPGADIIKPSDGVWTIPQYLEVSNSPLNASFVGKQVTGVASGAQAFIDRLVRRKIGSKFIDIFFITNLTKNFITGEQLAVSPDLIDVPIVIGSLTDLIVDDGGYGFNVGDVVTLKSNFGAEGTARVAQTSNVTGIVTFNLIDGGWGYTPNSQILISNVIVQLANVNTTLPTNTRPIAKFSNVVLSIPGNPASNVYANAFAISTTANLICNSYVGRFVVGEKVISGDNNCIATVRSATANSTAVVINVSNVYNSYFQTGLTLQGQSSGATANVQSIQTDIGVTGVIGSVNSQYTQLQCTYPRVATVSSNTSAFLPSEVIFQNNGTANVAKGILYSANSSQLTFSVTFGTFTTAYQVKGNTTGANAVLSAVIPQQSVNATITGFTSGISANIAITNVYSTETYFYYTDLISGNNSLTPNTPYVALPLNATQYGFPGAPTANASPGSALLCFVLQYQTLNLGEIQLIQTTNPGKNYNDNPYVEIYQPGIATALVQDYNITFNTATGLFQNNEIITQSTPLPGIVDLVVTNVHSNFILGEVVTINSANVGSIWNYSNTALFINNSVPIASGANIVGYSSNANATITAVTASTNGAAIGRIKFVNTSAMSVKRMSFKNSFQANLTITGSLSGATANVVTVVANTASLYSGDNANITSNVISSNGTVKALTVYSSGIGYVNGEIITFLAANTTNTTNSGTAITLLGQQGQGQGYYSSENGFLSANKYIQDGEFYSPFSYEVKSSLDLTKYQNMVRDVVHMAGTGLYGAVYKKTIVQTPLNIQSQGPKKS